MYSRKRARNVLFDWKVNSIQKVFQFNYKSVFSLSRFECSTVSLSFCSWLSPLQVRKEAWLRTVGISKIKWSPWGLFPHSTVISLPFPENNIIFFLLPSHSHMCVFCGTCGICISNEHVDCLSSTYDIVYMVGRCRRRKKECVCEGYGERDIGRDIMFFLRFFCWFESTNFIFFLSSLLMVCGNMFFFFIWENRDSSVFRFVCCCYTSFCMVSKYFVVMEMKIVFGCHSFLYMENVNERIKDTIFEYWVELKFIIMVILWDSASTLGLFSRLGIVNCETFELNFVVDGYLRGDDDFAATITEYGC